MKNLTIGKRLTVLNLADVLGVNYGDMDLDAIENGNTTCIDNFDGENGINVYFKAVRKSENVFNWLVEIVDIDNL